MSTLAWLLAAAAFQADPAAEIARQAARVTAKDPRASFDAVSRLADCSAGSKAAVEAVASTWPADLAFYREALVEEIRCRETMGARYPKLKRVSLDLKDQAPQAAFSQLMMNSGQNVDLRYFRKGAGGVTLTMELKDVSFMEALDALCRGSKTGVFDNGGRMAVNPGQENVGSIAYRHFLVYIPTANRGRKIEFGAGETRNLQVTVQLLSDSEAGIIRAGRPRITEAVDAGGLAVREIPDDPAEEPSEEKPKTGPVLYTATVSTQYTLSFALPKGDTLARLRGWYDVAVSGERSSFEFSDLSKEQKKSDGHFDVEAFQKADGGLTKLTVRVTPKGGMEALQKMSTVMVAGWNNGFEAPIHTVGKIGDGRIEYAYSYPSTQNGEGLKSVVFRIHRTTVERRIPFEFTDLSFK